MGVPSSEVGYTAAMPRREDHEVHKDMCWHWGGGVHTIRHVSAVPSPFHLRSVRTVCVHTVRRVQSPSRTAHDRRPAIISVKYAAQCHGMLFTLFANYENFGENRMICLFSVALRPNAGHVLLILEVSRSHTTTHHSR